MKKSEQLNIIWPILCVFTAVGLYTNGQYSLCFIWLILSTAVTHYDKDDDHFDDFGFR